MLSFWEIQNLREGYDVLIVGAGITGCNAAIRLKTLEPELRVAIIEKEAMFLTTASTKNAGFACFGSLSELLEDQESIGEAAMLRLVRKRWKGLEYLRSIVSDDEMRYKPCGGLEVFEDQVLFDTCKDKCQSINHLLKGIVGPRVFEMMDSLEPYGFNGFKSGIVNSYEGQLNPARMMSAFHKRLREIDVPVLAGRAVDSLEDLGSKVLVQVGKMEIYARHVMVTTNGLAKRLIDVDVRPTRAQVLITAPIKNLKWSKVVHLDRGYTYFRNVEDRILIGGRRNYDENTEFSSEMELNLFLQDQLESLLRKQIVPDQEVTIAHRWAGIMGTGSTRDPILKSVKDRIHCAVRLGGMGVAIGSLLGKEAAERLVGRD